MQEKIIKDYSVSKEEFRLEYQEKYKMYSTQFYQYEILDKYYQSENYISHTDQLRTWFEILYQSIKKITIRQKWKLIKKYTKKEKINILDIGSGTGEFLKFGIEKKIANGVGVEPNNKARNISINKKVLVYENINQLPKDNYDVITLWHVIEHISELDSYFKFLNKHIANDGYLVIAVPNFNSYDAKYYENYWAGWDVPRHLWHFSKESLPLLLQPFSFELVDIKPMYFDSYYVSLLSEQYKTGKKNIIKAFIIGTLSNIKARKNKEYSSLIYIFRKV